MHIKPFFGALFGQLVPGKAALIKTVIWLLLGVLPFYQPIATPLTVLASGLFFAWQIGKFSQRFNLGLLLRTTLVLAGFALGLLAYGTAYWLISLFVVPVLHSQTILMWGWFSVWAMAAFALATTLGLITWQKLSKAQQGLPYRSLAVIWLLSVVTGGFSWFSNTNQSFYDWQVMKSLNPEILSVLPDSDPDNVRILPQVTGQDYAENSNRLNQSWTAKPFLGPCPDNKSKQCWLSSLHLRSRQEGIWYNLTDDVVMDVIAQPAGKVAMETSTQPRGAFFAMGAQSWATRAAFAMHHPFSKAERAIPYHKENGSWVLLIPYTSYRPTLFGTMVPYLAGVMEVSEWGLIWDHSVSSAIGEFPNTPFYPTPMARWYAEKYAQWRGDIAGLITKADRLKISEPQVTGDKDWNPPPYLEVFKAIGQQAVIALEPDASGTSTLRELLFFDAATGKPRVYRVPHDKVLNGPREAMGAIRKLDFEAALKSKKVEPSFIIKHGELFYLVKMVSVEDEGKDTASYPYNESVIIDAATLGRGKVVYDGPDLTTFLLDEHEVLPPLKTIK